MAKDPSPKADGLRAMREASRGHLQATVKPLTLEQQKQRERCAQHFDAHPRPAPRKLIPYAGKAPGSRDDLIGNKNPPASTKPARKRKKLKRKIA